MTTGGQQRPPPDEGPEDESNSTTTCEIGKAPWRRIWALLGCGDEDSSGSSKLWLAKEVVGGSGSGRSRSGSTNLRFLIHPDNWWYVAWTYFILVWAVYSSFFTPLEFGFFRGLPERLFLLDIAGQIAFLADIALQFNLAYRDAHTYRIVYSRNQIALRYLKSRFGVDLLGCLPWDAIYKACGRKEAVRYMLWIRLSRALRVTEFFEKLEKEIRINYLFTRIVKLLVVEYYCTHTAACIFYYLATTVPPSHEGYTWMGSLRMGDFHYSNFRDIDLWKRYVTSLYFAVVTMATVGYGEIHAVNVREMIFVMIYVSFDMILGAYLLGNMTALIVKGSKTERFRDKMTEVLKYVNRNNLGKQICNEVKGHLRLQYERSCNEAAVLQDIPASIRTKISQKLYEPFIKEASLFKGCSSGFIKQIAVRVHEEFFLPGEVIIEEGKIADQLYIVCHGELEEVARGKDDESENIVVNLQMYSIFGELSFLCNIPQPYAVRVRELSQVLRLDKQSWTEILEVYFFDGTIILDNLLEGKDPELQNMILASDVTLYIGKHESELALKLNAATYDGNLHQVKRLIGAGADPKKTDYDGRSPLHIAACKGYEELTVFLIEQGLDTNAVDKFGNTPLLEAVKNRRDQVALLLVNAGASLLIDNEGVFLCTTVARKEVGLLRRLLDAGANPNAKDYDFRTPLHVAASEGSNVAVRLLLDSGGSIFSKDRWGHTPLDEARIGGNKDLIKLLEAARSSQISEFSCSSQQTGDEARRKKCTVFPFHPWTEEKRRQGVVEWVPETMDELIKTAVERLKCPNVEYSILSEDGAKIMDVNMIDSGQKLFLVAET